MDVFYPSSQSQGKTPIVFFEYGGGLTTGGRTFPSSTSLTYANAATFFAHRGFIAIIADYRLVPHVMFPGPAEDIRDALAWIVANPTHLVSPQTLTPDLESIFLVGHSAGALHIATMLLLPNFIPVALQRRIKGAVLVSGPYEFQSLDEEHTKLIEQYYGGRLDAEKNSPQVLLVRTSAIDVLPPLLLVEAEREPRFLQMAGKNFYDTLLSFHPSTNVRMILAQGHNHFSIVWALSSGEGEEWGEQATEWMRALLN